MQSFIFLFVIVLVFTCFEIASQHTQKKALENRREETSEDGCALGEVEADLGHPRLRFCR